MSIRLGLLASGGGTTAKYLATEVCGPNIDGVEIGCAISSLTNAGNVGKMREFEIPTYVVRLKDFPDDPMGFGERILEILHHHGVTHVLQCGWMPKTPDNVTSAFKGRIFNQHPGLTPEFGGEKMAGKTVHDAVLRFRDKVLDATGRTFSKTVVVAHRSISESDAGPIVQSGNVPVFAKAKVDDLQDLALPVEWRVMRGLVLDIRNDNVQEQQIPSLVLPGEGHLLAEAKAEAIAAAKKH